MHRNSQKRIHAPGQAVFVTSVTADRVEFFAEPILAELFVHDLVFTKILKNFELLGFTVMPDHVHLLFLPRGKAEYPEIMRSIKTNFSRNANDILMDRVDEKFEQFISLRRRRVHVNPPSAEGRSSDADVNGRSSGNDVNASSDDVDIDASGISHTDPQFIEHWLNLVPQFKLRFNEKYGGEKPFAKFKWQSSYRDHIIRDRKDLQNHLLYIYNNAVKHGIATEPEEWRWMWVMGMDKFPVTDVDVESLFSPYI